jgi:polar amino acid transport system substrate-binding protein
MTPSLTVSIVKRLAAIGVALMCVVFLTGARPSEYPPDMQKIITRGKLVVAMYGKDRPPFITEGSTGVLTGVDVELARSIGDHLGVPIEINRSAGTFDAIVDLVANGRADIGISLLSATTERARRVLFTDPYLSVCPSLLVNRLKEIDFKRAGAGRDWLQRPEVSIGVMRGSSYEGYAREVFPHARIVAYDDWGMLKRAVFRGDVTAAYQSGATLNQMIVEEPEIYLTLRLIEIEGKEDLFACALPATSIHFLTWMNLLIAQRGELSRRLLEEAMIRSLKIYKEQ